MTSSHRTFKDRRIGLNANDRPKPLLSLVAGRPVNTQRSSRDSQHSLPEMNRAAKAENEADIYRSPEATSDEYEKTISPGRLPPHDPIETSSDEDMQRRNTDIRSTTFTKAAERSSKATKASSSKPQSAGTTGYKGTAFHKPSRNEGPSSSASSKRSAEEPLIRPGSSLGTSRSKKKQKLKNTFGSQPRSSQPRSSQPRKSSQPRPSQKGATKTPSPSAPPKPKFIRFAASSSPESHRTEEQKSYKNDHLNDGSPSPIRKDTKFTVHDLDADSVFDSFPKKAQMRHCNSDDEDMGTGNQTSQRPLRSSKARESKENNTSGEAPQSQRPAFRMHNFDEVDEYMGSNDDVSVLSHNRLRGDVSDDMDENEEDETSLTRCPMCQEVVDRNLFQKHSINGKMTVKKQTAFCRLHKRKEALASDSKYPKINWETLQNRISRHHQFLRGVLEGTESSHYADLLREKVQSGKNRTLLKTDDSLTPGYYGPRGLRTMTEYIMRTMSSIVRKRAVEDRLISARGYTNYVQAVLIPELAVRLIMEDMGVTIEVARSILRESVEVGELLYEDTGDVIVNVGEEEEED
ncbi:RTC4-like domain-containing protein [Xylariaceae sp. FL0016]|nr:RTC4-like domain-containing protein [Xylariaceae sp. FL0016]